MCQGVLDRLPPPFFVVHRRQSLELAFFFSVGLQSRLGINWSELESFVRKTGLHLLNSETVTSAVLTLFIGSVLAQISRCLGTGVPTVDILHLRFDVLTLFIASVSAETSGYLGTGVPSDNIPQHLHFD